MRVLLIGAVDLSVGQQRQHDVGRGLLGGGAARAGFHRLAEVVDGEDEGAGLPAQLAEPVHDALAFGGVVLAP